MSRIRTIRLAGAFVACLLVGATSAGAQETIRIGIANFGEHPQLNASIAGFKAALDEAGYTEGDKVIYSESHTNFDASLVPQMIARLEAEAPSLLYVVTTPVAQIAKQVLYGSNIPIVFSAVTDPVAANLVPSWDSGDDGMTGASDLQDVSAVLEFTRRLLPDARRLGVPYNPGEANDVAIVDAFTRLAPAAGFEIVTVGVDNVNDIQQRITTFAGKVDVIYVPTSNLLQPAVAAVAAAARQAGIPIVNADDGVVRQGIVPASFAVNYEQVGAAAARIVLRILAGEDPKMIPPSRPAYEDHAPVISRKAMAAFGVELPASFTDCACVID